MAACQAPGPLYAPLSTGYDCGRSPGAETRFGPEPGRARRRHRGASGRGPRPAGPQAQRPRCVPGARAAPCQGGRRRAGPPRRSHLQLPPEQGAAPAGASAQKGRQHRHGRRAERRRQGHRPARVAGAPPRPSASPRLARRPPTALHQSQPRRAGPAAIDLQPEGGGAAGPQPSGPACSPARRNLQAPRSWKCQLGTQQTLPRMLVSGYTTP